MHPLRRALFITSILFGSAIIGIAWHTMLRRPEHPPGGVAAADTAPALAGEAKPATRYVPTTNNAPVTVPAPAKSRDALTGAAAIEALRKEDRYQSLAAAVGAARYAPEKIDPGATNSRGADYFASNPTSQLRAWFGKGGLELASGMKTESEDNPWAFKLRLNGVGRPNDVAPSAQGNRSVALREKTVEIADASGLVTEWYKNREEGLEQGFTIHKRPSGETGNLEVRLQVEGDLQPEARDDLGKCLHFNDADGHAVFRYSGLTAWDASGRELPSRMEIRGREIALVVADAGAKYPVTVDPLFASTEARLTQESVERSDFGRSVAISGNTVVVGAPLDDSVDAIDSGRAFVFFRDREIWMEQARLTAPFVISGNQFGTSVALDGDTALIGSPTNGQPFAEGSAHVFRRTGTVWNLDSTLRASASTTTTTFANRSPIVISDTSPPVTTPYPASINITGVAGTISNVRVRLNEFIHTFPADLRILVVSPSGRSTLLMSNAGGSTPIGTTVVFDDNAAEQIETFNLVNGGSFRPTAIDRSSLPPTAPAAPAEGYSTSLSNFAGESANGNWQLYVADTFPLDGGFIAGGWELDITSTTLPAFDRNAGFGTSVSLKGPVALVGAPRDVNSANMRSGAAYVYFNSNGTWLQEAKLVANDGNAADEFGTSVSVDGFTALVGAPGKETDFGDADAGAAYVFISPTVGVWNQQQKLESLGGSVVVSQVKQSNPAPITINDSSVATPFPSRVQIAGANGTVIEASVKLNGFTHTFPADTRFLLVSPTGRASIIMAGAGGGTPVSNLVVTLTDFASGQVPSGNFVSGLYLPTVNRTTDFPFPAPEGPYGTTFSNFVGDDPNGIWSLYVLDDFAPDVGIISGGWELTLLVSTSPRLGTAVALEGNTALVGAPRANSLAGTATGAATIFERTGTTWNPTVEFYPLGGATGDLFGKSVALKGDTALIGATRSDTFGGLNSGNASFFQKVNGVWFFGPSVTGTDGATNDFFGSSVALGDTVAVIGVPGDDTNAGIDAGSVQIFKRVRGDGVGSNTGSITINDNSVASPYPSAIDISGLNGQIADLRVTIFGYSHTFTGDTRILLVSPSGRGVILMSNVGFNQVANSFAVTFSDTAPGPIPLSGFVSGTYLPSSSNGNDFPFPAPFGPYANTLGALRGEFPNGTWNLYVLDTAPPDSGAISGGWQLEIMASVDKWNADVPLNSSSGAEFDSLATSVAISGDTAVVGTPDEDTFNGSDVGAAYVFVRNGNTSWRQQARLLSADGAPTDAFGTSVAIDGQTTVVGAPRRDTPTRDAGAAYIFVRSGELWQQQQRITMAGGTAGDLFGTSVGISGESLVAGAPSGGGGNTGVAAVFVRNGATWTLQVFAPGVSSGDHLGFSVDIDGDIACAGAPGLDGASGADSGQIYVYERTGTTWAFVAALEPFDSAANDRFGASISLSGTTLIGGAPGSFFGTGSAYIFSKAFSTWRQEAKLVASNGFFFDTFGTSVAISGDTALVGSPKAGSLLDLGAGAAYVYRREGGAWTQQVTLNSGIDRSRDDLFGQSVAASGDTLIVGASKDDTTGTDSGSAYIFQLGELPAIIQQPVSRTVVPGVAVGFTVVATGDAPLRFQWRKNGIEIERATGDTFTIAAAQVADQGTYDVVISNAGGTATSAAAVLSVNNLAEFTQQAPGPLPDVSGFVVVNLLPPDLAGRAWRFVGEQQWRDSGVPVSGLAVGNREIEFRPVPGFLHPLREPVSLLGGQALVVEREYFNSGTGESGSLGVTLLPASITGAGLPVGSRAQWRLLGEGDNAWRNSGVALPGLSPGVYLVECRDVDNFTTPRPKSVSVVANQTNLTTATYFLADAPVGQQPAVVGFDAINAAGPNPLKFVGQLRSDSGSGTGFVVRRRVVATAAHVVFDDGTLSTVTSLQWLFQRDRGSYEPVPQIPRGSYILSGYAQQRAADNSPGASSAASQNLDVAAVWFFEEDAARGGFAGFLASDDADNEWLLSSRLKTLVGYPLDDTPLANQGRLHATPIGNFTFTKASNRVYLTSDITSRGGNSGGPLCVQYDDGNFFPAAVYLGGTTQTRVRVIDSDVITIFDSAEESSNTGQNSANGGIPQGNSPLSAPAPGTITVNIEPASARNAGAGWRIGTGTFLNGGQSRSFLSPGGYSVNFKAITGFSTPANRSVTVTANNTTTITVTYPQPQPPNITGPSLVRAVRAAPLTINIQATNSPTLFNVSGLAGTGLSLTNNVTGVISGTPAENGTFPITVVAQNDSGSSPPFTITLLVADQGSLTVQTDPTRGSVTVKPKRVGNIFPQGETVTLTAKAVEPDFLFAGWEFTGAVPSSLTATTTTFVMTESVTAEANFVPNPYITRLGSYTGLLVQGALPAGIATLKVSKTGSFSLKMTIAGIRYSLSGKLDGAGNFVGTIARRNLDPVAVTLLFDTISPTPRARGTITVDGVAYALDAAVAPFTSKNATLLAGKYTLTLPPDPANPDPATYPAGHGYATITVSTAGAIRAAGQLGDGTKLSASGSLLMDNTWPVHVIPHAGEGIVAGVLSFTPHAAPDFDEIGGTLRWEKPVSTKGPYLGAFQGSIVALGSRYNVPASGTRALDITNWTLTLGTGVLNPVITEVVTLDQSNKFEISPAQGVKLTLAASTGLLTTSFNGPTGKRITAKGVLLQRQRIGRGVFVLPDRSGPFTLLP